MGKGQQPLKINTRRGRGNLECMDEVRLLREPTMWGRPPQPAAPACGLPDMLVLTDTS